MPDTQVTVTLTTAGAPTELHLTHSKLETAATLRLLEAIPEGKLAWRPHPKSMTLGSSARTSRASRR